ncbi:DUF1801 domain-containing protein [Panacibacter sp. DH6]|uniref:DUF1801 domain-containing protein n=1 Tax=Panacibacter microcysteis TaxID=2793269 RepID=A0A931E580_9BACT|nr:DUF1801 domain-containing protein [Panacibacter microcysteis]MBG9377283.1 DUF1801 domain-containing protein [Panacibacter microcysteis]
MLRTIDQYFLQQAEPNKSCLLFLRAHIQALDVHIKEVWKYGMPCYCYNNKMCCYLWVHKKLMQPYIGIVEGNKINHPLLISEKRARMKILLVDPEKDIPLKLINGILNDAFALCQ